MWLLGEINELIIEIKPYPVNYHMQDFRSG